MDVVLISSSPPPLHLYPCFCRVKPNDVPCDKCWLTASHQHSRPNRHRRAHAHVYTLHTLTHNLIHSGQQLVALPTVSPWLEGDIGSRCDSILPDRSGRRKQEPADWEGKETSHSRSCLHPLLHGKHTTDCSNHCIAMATSEQRPRLHPITLEILFLSFTTPPFIHDVCSPPPCDRGKHNKLLHYLLCSSFVEGTMGLSFQEAFSLPRPATF